jgi:uncharacterized protein (DUF488 family)
MKQLARIHRFFMSIKVMRVSCHRMLRNRFLVARKRRELNIYKKSDQIKNSDFWIEIGE